ncbi:MAG: hypothetical protein PHF51_01790 [Candidatus ainarchaeum sp.]|nr:hypothetical protein [Candidatus ainarchaeum sp.]
MLILVFLGYLVSASINLTEAKHICISNLNEIEVYNNHPIQFTHSSPSYILQLCGETFSNCSAEGSAESIGVFKTAYAYCKNIGKMWYTHYVNEGDYQRAIDSIEQISEDVRHFGGLIWVNDTENFTPYYWTAIDDEIATLRSNARDEAYSCVYLEHATNLSARKLAGFGSPALTNNCLCDVALENVNDTMRLADMCVAACENYTPSPCFALRAQVADMYAYRLYNYSDQKRILGEYYEDAYNKLAEQRSDESAYYANISAGNYLAYAEYIATIAQGTPPLQLDLTTLIDYFRGQDAASNNWTQAKKYLQKSASLFQQANEKTRTAEALTDYIYVSRDLVIFHAIRDQLILLICFVCVIIILSSLGVAHVFYPSRIPKIGIQTGKIDSVSKTLLLFTVTLWVGMAFSSSSIDNTFIQIDEVVINLNNLSDTGFSVPAFIERIEILNNNLHASIIANLFAIIAMFCILGAYLTLAISVRNRQIQDMIATIAVNIGLFSILISMLFLTWRYSHDILFLLALYALIAIAAVLISKKAKNVTNPVDMNTSEKDLPSMPQQQTKKGRRRTPKIQ